MTKSKAIKSADKMTKTVNVPCYVIKIKKKFKWYMVSTWAKSFINVSEHFIQSSNYNGKIYYSTKS